MSKGVLCFGGLVTISISARRGLDGMIAVSHTPALSLDSTFIKVDGSVVELCRIDDLKAL